MQKGPYNIVLLQPPGYIHAGVFAEIAQLLFHSLQSLGLQCALSVNQPDPAAVNILLGYHLLTKPAEMRRFKVVIYQFEQLSKTNQWFNQRWLDLLGHASQIWDYSKANIAFMRQRGLERVKLLPVGFHEKLRVIQPETEDIDVLFYGSVNERRRKILNALDGRCNVKALFGTYGPERDRYIARSKIVLNLHLHPSEIFEQARVSYLLNNARFVLSETSSDDPYGGIVPVAGYEQIAERCLIYLQETEARQNLAQRGYERFSQMPMVELLRPLLA